MILSTKSQLKMFKICENDCRILLDQYIQGKNYLETHMIENLQEFLYCGRESIYKGRMGICCLITFLDAMDGQN